MNKEEAEGQFKRSLEELTFKYYSDLESNITTYIDPLFSCIFNKEGTQMIGKTKQGKGQ